MAFEADAIIVGDTNVVQIVNPLTHTFSGLLKNIGNKTAYLGDENVSLATGFPLDPGDVLESDVPVGATLFAIGETGGTELRWLAVD